MGLPLATDLPYERISYAEIRTELEKARRWYEGVLSKPLDDTRLVQLETKLSEIMAILSGPKRDKIFELVDEVTAYHAWVDALGFISIARQFDSLADDVVPRRLLWRMLQGPLSPADEDTKDTDARNIFAQLEFAANVMKKGLQPRGFEDLEFVYLDCRYIAECKRLGSVKDTAVRRNLDNANKQLKSVLDRKEAGVRRGLLVLAVDRLAGFGTGVPRSVPIVSPGDIVRVSRAVAGNFSRLFGDAIANLDGRVSAIVLVTRMLVLEVMESSWATAYIPTIVPRVKRGTADYERLTRLADALKTED